MNAEEAKKFEEEYKRYEKYVLLNDRLKSQEAFKELLIDKKDKYSEIIEIASNCKNRTSDDKFWSNIIIKTNSDINKCPKISIHNENILKWIMPMLLDFINAEIDKTKQSINEI